MKKKNLTLLISILLAFTMIIPFLGNVVRADPKTSQTIILKFWYTENDAEKPVLLDKVARFENQHPNVDVQPEQKGFFGVGDEYRTAFIAGEEPDVLRTPRDDVVAFAEDGLIRALTSEFTPADIADFIPASLKLMTYEGDIWGFPQAIDCPMYLFNRAIFNASTIPNADMIDWSTSWTWGEFSRNIVHLNQTPGLQALSLAGMFFGAQPYYYGFGAYFFENDAYTRATIAINNTKSRSALAFLKNFTDSTYTPDWTEQGWANFGGDFATGKLAMIATGPWEILNLLTNAPQFNGTAYGNWNLGFMQLPHDADDNYGALIGGNYLTISSQIETSKYEAAVNFSKFMSGEGMMAYSAIENYHIPARLSVMANASVIAAPSFKYVQPYFQQAVNAYQLTPHPYYGQLEQAFGNRIDEYLAGDIDLDQTINKTILDWYEIIPPAAVPEEFIPGFPPQIVVFATMIGMLGLVLYTLKKRKTK
jgi:ABC-type glycerol-3-phosphate transport system substrate-binding protein